MVLFDYRLSDNLNHFTLDENIHGKLAVKLRAEAVAYQPEFHKPVHFPSLERWVFVNKLKMRTTEKRKTRSGMIVYDFIDVEGYLFKLFKIYPGQCHVLYKLIKKPEE